MENFTLEIKAALHTTYQGLQWGGESEPGCFWGLLLNMHSRCFQTDIRWQSHFNEREKVREASRETLDVSAVEVTILICLPNMFHSILIVKTAYFMLEVGQLEGERGECGIDI